jgi:hypothetical protein
MKLSFISASNKTLGMAASPATKIKYMKENKVGGNAMETPHVSGCDEKELRIEEYVRFEWGKRGAGAINAEAYEEESFSLKNEATADVKEV